MPKGGKRAGAGRKPNPLGEREIRKMIDGCAALVSQRDPDEPQAPGAFSLILTIRRDRNGTAEEKQIGPIVLSQLPRSLVGIFDLPQLCIDIFQVKERLTEVTELQRLHAVTAMSAGYGAAGGGPFSIGSGKGAPLEQPPVATMPRGIPIIKPEEK